MRAFSTKYYVNHCLFICTQLQEILEVLGIGPASKSDEGDYTDSLTVLCMTIRHPVIPVRLNRKEAEFRKSFSVISRPMSDFCSEHHFALAPCAELGHAPIDPDKAW